MPSTHIGACAVNYTFAIASITNHVVTSSHQSQTTFNKLFLLHPVFSGLSCFYQLLKPPHSLTHVDTTIWNNINIILLTLLRLRPPPLLPLLRLSRALHSYCLTLYSRFVLRRQETCPVPLYYLQCIPSH